MIPRPDKPPAPLPNRKRGMKPIGFETYQKPDGTWGLRPTGFKKGKEDVALRPRIILPKRPPLK